MKKRPIRDDTGAPLQLASDESYRRGYIEGINDMAKAAAHFCIDKENQKVCYALADWHIENMKKKSR